VPFTFHSFVGLLACSAGLLVARPVQAADWWFFKSQAQRLLEESQDARGRGEYERAQVLLQAAEQESDRLVPAIAYERGLIARDLGHPEEALELLKRAADGDPESDARIEVAATLVDLGRWPDAVAALRQAADERGSSFPVDMLVSDPRFAKLRGFQPFQDLVNQAREEQAGPLGRMLLKLERLEESARLMRDTFDEIALAVAFISRIFDALSASLIAFVFFGLLITFGVRQLGLLLPPWTLLLGMAIASVIWSWGARVATLGDSRGLKTIAIGWLVVFLPWLVILVARLSVRLYRERRDGAPFAAPQLTTTLALVDAVAQAGRLLVSAKADERVQAEKQLEAARKALYAQLRLRRF
jgi:tetratricopeptide (TPR) repeat protein